MNNIPIFFASDDNYAGPLSVAIESIKSNRNEKCIYDIYVLTTGLNEENIKRITSLNEVRFNVNIVDTNAYLMKVKDNLSIRDYYSYSTYLRFFIADMFKDIDKGIYLDSDLVINTDIKELYDFNLEDNYLCATVDDVVPTIETFKDYTKYVLGIDPEKYFNAGILLMNLNKMRQDNILEKFIELSKVRKFKVAQDQDYLNVLCASKVKYLDKPWNKIAMYEKDFNDNPKIIHYKLSYKPWHYKYIMYENLFWKHARNTLYYTDLLKERNSYRNQEEDEKGYINLINLAKEEIGKMNVIREIYDDGPFYRN